MSLTLSGSADGSASSLAGSGARPRTTIPFDVITYIMAQSTPSTISALMKTCQLYYCEGPRHLLRRGVILRSDEQLARFVTFICADGGVRYAHFKQLDIAFQRRQFFPLPSQIDRIMDHLMQLLDSSKILLQNLSILDAEWLLPSIPCGSALREIKTLKTLTLHECGPLACSALGSMCSPLVGLTINFQDTAHFGLGTQRWTTLLHTLTSYSKTLETIQCNASPRLGDDPPAHPPSSPPSVPPTATLLTHFGAMRTLRISCDRHMAAERLDFAALTSSFPNLTCLELIPTHDRLLWDDSSIGSGDDTPVRPVPPSPETRKNRVLDRASFWQTLEICSGDVVSLHALGLGCHVVDLRIWGQVEGDAEKAMLVAIVITTRPKVLRLSVDGLEALQGVLSVMRNAKFEALDTLHIIFTMRELYRDDVVPVDLDEHIFKALTPFPPQVLALELFIEFQGSYLYTPMPDAHALEKLGDRLMAHASTTLQRVQVRHAKGYRLQPSNGRDHENDDSYLDSGDDEDGFRYDGDHFSDDLWDELQGYEDYNDQYDSDLSDSSDEGDYNDYGVCDAW